jgi:hypothetical protein
MTDESQEQQSENKEPSSASSTSPRKIRQVVVTHLDSPPPSGKKSIHPRRPAPIVPSHEQRIEEQRGKKTESSD